MKPGKAVRTGRNAAVPAPRRRARAARMFVALCRWRLGWPFAEELDFKCCPRP